MRCWIHRRWIWDWIFLPSGSRANCTDTARCRRRTGQGNTADAAAGQGDTPDAAAGQGDTPDAAAGQGDTADAAAGQNDAPGEEPRLTLRELAAFVSDAVSGNLLLQRLLSEERKESLDKAPALLQEAGRQLKGPDHSLMLISTSLPQESDETSAFLSELKKLCGDSLSGNWYLIGNTPMAMEMVDTFSGELNFLTLLTAGAIFLVVLATFRSLAVPAILVLLIQSAVYMTMILINLQGMTIYYLALLIVQSILMGATIDYAILFTNYYREMRRTKDPEDALKDAYNRSVHTILTSGVIVIVVTAIVGYAFSDPSVRQIVHTISKGAACAVILILFVLPGLLTALDRFVVSGKARGSEVPNVSSLLHASLTANRFKPRRIPLYDWAQILSSWTAFIEQPDRPVISPYRAQMKDSSYLQVWSRTAMTLPSIPGRSPPLRAPRLNQFVDSR